MSRAARIVGVVALAAAGGLAVPAWAAPCNIDLDAEVRAVSRALARQQLVEAVTRAEAALAQCPREGVLVRLAARAQAATGNVGAARALLRAHLAARPDDCESWSHLTWAELVANNPAEAWQALLAPACPSTPQERSRWALLEALAHRHQEDRKAEGEALDRLGDRASMWPEDDRARAVLERRRDPSWTWPWRASCELGLGGTTEAFAGSPTDSATSGVGSAIARLAASSTLRGPRSGRVTPFVEATVRGHGIEDERARELSYLELGGRAGAEIRLGDTQLALGVRRDVLHLDQATSRFAEGWRGELDVQTGTGFVLFAGGGRREFHDRWRTRTEWDGGLAGALRPWGVPLTVALAARRHDAERAPYDLRGATLTLVSRLPVGRGWLLRASAQGSWDDYPHSRTWEALIAFGSAKGRHEATMRLSLGVWRSFSRCLQGAVTYEYGQRWSSIEKGYHGSFSYREHRALATLRLELWGNPWRRGRTAADHVPIDWGLDAGAGALGGESIRDLVRQDEELRPDCGCSPS
ncbi:MAG TPA: hypothetical protein P5234_09315 [Thermoanaerobaculaceae bacterium]|nr:hypothetical protein [Thermoanaerobaculaceae bacterium]HRS16430.1 hypothetical protein [Thermoanaerobaculaceae bacterium]